MPPWSWIMLLNGFKTTHKTEFWMITEVVVVYECSYCPWQTSVCILLLQDQWMKNWSCGWWWQCQMFKWRCCVSGRTMSPLAELYSTSTMEHHHFDQCIMILSTKVTPTLHNTTPHYTAAPQHYTTLSCSILHYTSVYYILHYTSDQCIMLLSTKVTPTLHNTTLHYTTLHCTTLYCTTLHCITLQYTALYYTTLHYTTLNCNALLCPALHCTTLHYNPLLYTALHYTAIHYTRQHYTALHYITLHYTMPHYTPAQWTWSCPQI